MKEEIVKKKKGKFLIYSCTNEKNHVYEISSLSCVSHLFRCNASMYHRLGTSLMR